MTTQVGRRYTGEGGQDLRGQLDTREHQVPEGGLPRDGLHPEAAEEAAPEGGD